MGLSVRSRLRPEEEPGAVLVIVAISLIAILGMLVLVLDVGGLLLKRRAMVNGADAAALAAAQSCAFLPGAQYANGPVGDPQQQADALATTNASNAVGGIDTSRSVRCQTGDPGHVTVVYSATQSLFFAGVFGAGSTSNVGGTATAAWAPLASGQAIPVMLDSGNLQGPCKVPDGVAIGDTCAFWFNNGNSALGNSSWGYLNLDKWNVPATSSCPNSGSANRRQYIQGGYPTALPLNGSPPGTSPTYVCVDGGHSAANWSDIAGEAGKVKLFPVNDCNGQVDKSGAPVACGDPSTPDKYDIIGFTHLLIKNVYKGDDPAAVGTFGASGNCQLSKQSLVVNKTYSLPNILSGQANTSGCPTASPPISSIASIKVSYGKTTVTCPSAGLCAYNSATGQITWLGAAQSNVTISFDWAFANTAGKCGTRPPDPNAICLVTEWRGFTQRLRRKM